MKPLRIAMLVHSTNPRGGVVHAMELCSALHELGHHVTLHAPDAGSRGYFRKGKYQQTLIEVQPAREGVHAMVRQRIDDYVQYFTSIAKQSFDIYHAHDGISGNALATLTERGLIPGYTRTVHHMDEFSDPRLNELQLRSLVEAENIFCVSKTWQQYLSTNLSLQSNLVPTGVDRGRFSPQTTSADVALRATLGLRENTKIFLSIGGIEPRKNTLNILMAFEALHRDIPDSQLIIAGGTTLLDHSDYTSMFSTAAQSTGLRFGSGEDVILAERISDDAMPSLYRAANALVFPSVREGFGLVVLEALASGTPVILSRIAPFTEYMPESGCLWVDPHQVESIIHAMRRSLVASVSSSLRASGLLTAQSFSWNRSAHIHADLYKAVLRNRPHSSIFNSESRSAGVSHA